MKPAYTFFRCLYFIIEQQTQKKYKFIAYL